MVARAQQPDRVRRVGMLLPFPENDVEIQSQVAAFRERLRRLGWTEGRNLKIDYRWAALDAGLLQAFAKELVASQPDVIVARATPALQALLQETRTIPIVFALVSDPVGSGFVESLARPGGNVTGVTAFEYAMAGKWLELLKEMVPQVEQVGILFSPDTSAGHGSLYTGAVQAAGPLVGVRTTHMPIRAAGDIERNIDAFAQKSNGSLLVLPDVTTGVYREAIISLAARYRMPALYAYRYFVADGGLISYGVDPADEYRRAASYVNRILGGVNPKELPVQAPVKFEMAINLKTAKTLGITIPESVLLRADEVIE